MFGREFLLGGVCFAGLTFLLLPATEAFGQAKVKPRADLGKTMVIEKPAEALIAKESSPVPAADDFVNPKVRPGLVKWHPSWNAACQASQKSGKPVLLFQMMGKLDDQFC